MYSMFITSLKSGIIYADMNEGNCSHCVTSQNLFSQWALGVQDVGFLASIKAHKFCTLTFSSSEM